MVEKVSQASVGSVLQTYNFAGSQVALFAKRRRNLPDIRSS